MIRGRAGRRGSPWAERSGRAAAYRRRWASRFPSFRDSGRGKYRPKSSVDIRPYVGPAGYFVGIDVDQLDHPIGIRAAGGGDQVGDRLAADLHRGGQDIGDEDQRHPGGPEASRWSSTSQSTRSFRCRSPSADWARAERNGLGRIGNVFVEGCVACLRRGEAQFSAGVQIERRRLDVQPLAQPAGQEGRCRQGWCRSRTR